MMNLRSGKHTKPLAAGVTALLLLLQGGCWIPTLIGGMAESYKASSTHEIPLEYDGLQGHSFAVMVTADRRIQSLDPGLVARLTLAMTNRLVENAGASGVVPAPTILELQYSTPGWAAIDYQQICETLGVERLIIVDLYEYRLNEPGNAYLWDGQATAQVGVVEAGGILGDDFVYSKTVSVGFPDGSGFGPADMPMQTVAQRLQQRLIDRVTWLFFDHEEMYYMDY
ncbi:MAG: hypothetical protein H6814_04085 [Phycisphaeraceae bacterium]|nr:hypothetical protein [Phycisphaeraceae bacterium]